MIHRLLQSRSEGFRVLTVAFSWLVLITLLHMYLNAERQAARTVLMGYMPVITNLSAPLVDTASAGNPVHYQAVKFASFAEMGESFRAGHIEVAFIIAPLAFVLKQQGVPLKVVYIGNRHESTLVVRKDLSAETLLDLQGRTIAVPIRFSGHLLALKRYLTQQGLSAEAIRTVEISPPDMPAALASGGIDGYFVGEPFASKAIQSGIGRKLLDVEAIWPNFICNLVIVRKELIEKHPGWVEELVASLVRAGFFARDHEEEAQKILCRYWGQSPEVVAHAFSNPPGRFRFDLYTPVADEMAEVSAEMVHAGLMESRVPIQDMVEDRFARSVAPQRVDSLGDIVPKGSSPKAEHP